MIVEGILYKTAWNDDNIVIYDYGHNQWSQSYNELLQILEIYHKQARQISFENPYSVMCLVFQFGYRKQVFYYVNNELFNKTIMRNGYNINPTIHYLLGYSSLEEYLREQSTRQDLGIILDDKEFDNVLNY